MTGVIVARFGYRSLLLSGLILGAVISAHQATPPPFSLMLASRLLEGAYHLIVVVAAPTLVAHVNPDRHRAQAMTLWGTFFDVAFALVAWFGLPLARVQGLACLFAVHPLAMALVAILLFVFLSRERHVSSDTSALTLGSILHKGIPTPTGRSTCHGMALLYPGLCVSHHRAP